MPEPVTTVAVGTFIVTIVSLLINACQSLFQSIRRCNTKCCDKSLISIEHQAQNKDVELVDAIKRLSSEHKPKHRKRHKHHRRTRSR